MPALYTPDNWHRSGRGAELQFFATDEEVRRWLESLPTKFGRCTLLYESQSDRAPAKGSYQVCPLDDWLRSLSGSETSRAIPFSQFFLQAEALTPVIPHIGKTFTDVNALAVINGLMLVQHGATRSGRRLASRVAVARSITNNVTGEVRDLSDRTLIFDELRRRIRKALAHTSLQVFRDGHEEEDRVQMMTDAAADLARTGFFSRKPGAPVRRPR